MNLLCLHDFNEGGYSARAGEVCWFMPNVAGWLLDSFPSAWVVSPPEPDPEPETAAIDAPPVDKMIRKAKAKRRG